MQTRTYVHALERTVELLRLEDLAELFGAFQAQSNRQLAPGEKTSFGELLFAMDTGFETVLRDSVLRDVAQGLDLQFLMSRAARTVLMTTFQNASSTHDILLKPQFVQLFVSARTIVRLRDGLRALLLSAGSESAGSGRDHLELEIEDYDDEGIPVRRVVAALASLLAMYEAIERHQGHSTATPVVKWMDSGSNIAFSVEGVASVIAEIRTTFAGVWRGVRFARNDKLERDIETALKQLALVRELDREVVGGGAAGEAAARTRHAILESMADLVGAGVMPTALEVQSTYERHEVLKAVRNTRLLGAGESVDVDNSGSQSNA